MSQERRDFQGYPAVYGIRPVVERPIQIRSLGDVRPRQVEKERLAGFAKTTPSASLLEITRFPLMM